MTAQVTRGVAARAAIGVALSLGIIHVVLADGSALRARPAAIEPGTIQLRLDPNRASVAELELLPGLGPKLAARIAAARDGAGERPSFRTAADLDLVPGIGPARVAQLAPFLRFEQTAAPSPPPATEP